MILDHASMKINSTLVLIQQLSHLFHSGRHIAGRAALLMSKGAAEGKKKKSRATVLSLSWIIQITQSIKSLLPLHIYFKVFE